MDIPPSIIRSCLGYEPLSNLYNKIEKHYVSTKEDACQCQQGYAYFVNNNIGQEFKK